MITYSFVCAFGMAAFWGQDNGQSFEPDVVGLIYMSRWPEVERALWKIGTFHQSKYREYGESIFGSLCRFSGKSDMNGNVLTGMRLLRDHGANPSGNHGCAMWHAAELDEWGDITERLIQYGVNPNAKCSANSAFEGLVPIYETAYQNKTSKVANILLKKGVNSNVFTVDPRNPTGDKSPLTPLMIAAFKNHYETVSALIKFKASKSLTSPISGMTALHYAAKGDSYQSIEILLKAGADKKLKDKKGRTPLAIAKSVKAKWSISLLK